MSGLAVRSGYQGLRGGLRFDVGGETRGQVCTLCWCFIIKTFPSLLSDV